MKKASQATTTPFWRDNRIIPIMLQIIFAILVIAAAVGLVLNTLKGMEKIGINFGFNFFNETAGFAIQDPPIKFGPTDTYSRAILVGFINTFKVSVIGIILATIIGVFVGIGRLSKNWLVRNVASGYIEVLRNIPLLVQIFIWLTIFLNLPQAKKALHFPGDVFLSNRGAAIPWFAANSATGTWTILFLVGVISAIFLWRKKLKAEVETGKRKYPAWWALGGILLSLIIAALITQSVPFHFNLPTETKFGYSGGYIIKPSFAAILFGLVFYTATYIAEIVRAGIMSVSKGQTEAAQALGLKSSTSMRLVIFPQAFRLIIPPITSQYLNLTKNSSLAIAVGFPDIVHVGKTILNQSGRAVEIIIVWMIVYLTLSLITSLLMNIFNKRMQLVER